MKYGKSLCLCVHNLFTDYFLIVKSALTFYTTLHNIVDS